MQDIDPKTYVFLSIMLYILVGISVYIVDRKIGTKFQRRKYNLTHRERLPLDKEFGFIYNRKTGVRICWAAVISTLTNISMVVFAQTNILTEVATWFLDTPAVYIGFLLGPMFYRMYKKRDGLFKQMDEFTDDLESGKVAENLKTGAQEVVEDLKGAASSAGAAVREKMGLGPSEETDDSVQKPGSTESVSEPEPPQETEEELRRLADQFRPRK